MEDFDSLSLAYIAPSKPVVDLTKIREEYSIGPSLPEFLSDNKQDDIRQWKIQHEQEMFHKLIESQQLLREKKLAAKMDVSKMLRKTPILLLTKDFLNKEKLTIDDRAYVIDKLIPVVVLGLEKLLIEADKRGLIEVKEIEPNFNPIDFLARYLMRNNPMFSNFNEASPYVRGCRKVCEELKMEIFHLSDNKLAKVKADSKNIRAEREKEEERKKLEAKRRIEIYQKLFDQFIIHNQTKVDYETVHISIKSFSQIVSAFPDEVKKTLEPIMQMKYCDEKTKKLGRKDFGLLISHYANEMPLDIFDQFAEHLSKCAKLYKMENEKEVRRQMLSNLFMTCDLTEMGMLDRQRILMLFDQFYEQSPDNIKDVLRDPRHWPISDYNRKAKELNEESAKDSNVNMVDQMDQMETESTKSEDNEENIENQNRNNADLSGGIEDTEDVKNELSLDHEEMADKSDLDVHIKGPEEVAQDEVNKEAEIIEKLKDEVEKEGEDRKEENIEESTQDKLENPIKSEKEISEENDDKKLESTQESEKITDEKLDKNLDSENDVKQLQITKEDSEKVIDNNKTEESSKFKTEINEKEASEDKEEDLSKKKESSKPTEQMEIENSEIIAKESTEKTEDGSPRDNTLDNANFSDLPLETNEGTKTSDTDKVIKKVQILEADLTTKSELTDEDGNEDNYDENDEENDDNEAGVNRELTKSSIITQSSAYDEENITFPQFFQVTEEFLGDSPIDTVLNDLIEYIRENYEETPEERLKRMKKSHRKIVSAKRRALIDELFNVWDSDNSGTVSMKDMCKMMSDYRNGLLDEGIKEAKLEARSKLARPIRNIKLNRREFRLFLYKVAEVCNMLEEESDMELMITYFIGVIQRTYVEKMRSEARLKWLTNISWAAEISHGRFEGVYRAVFQAIYKDVENHGNGKKVSISVALLEKNSVEIELRGKYILHFVAATPDQEEYVVGQMLDRSVKSVSFHTIYTGNPLYIPHVHSNNEIIYFNTNITLPAKEGAAVFMPIKDDLQRVFGLINIDSLNDPHADKANFETHEISYYQGVTKKFSSAFYHADMLRKLIKTSESAASWICRRVGSIRGATLYLRERYNVNSTTEFVLRQILQCDEQGVVVMMDTTSKRMQRQDNLFRNYVFEAIETSQTVTADAYGARNMAIPLRDLNGMAMAALDINIGSLRFLPQGDNNDVVQMMSLLQRAYNEVIKICTDQSELPLQLVDGDAANDDAEAEFVTTAIASNKAELMFDQLMLRDLRMAVSKLDAQSYAELKSYKDPPVTIRAIVESLLCMLYPIEANSGLFQNWEKCKKYINPGISRLILAFDPFGDISNISIDNLVEAMKKIPHSEIEKHGSKPAKDLFDWVFCCVSLIEHRIHSNNTKPE